MARNFEDWLTAFLRYCQGGESPTHVNFWVGVSTIAGCLRRKVWLDMKRFKWYPNCYVIIVAEPGIVSKTTTSEQGMRLLKRVPGIQFGPHVVTWESLVTKFAASAETFTYDDIDYTHSPLMLDSGEFGNLIDPHDRKMVDIFVRLWDCPEGNFDKETKTSGCDTIINPCINLIACTTPAWIAGNFPQYLIGGGFTSRCVFVYAEEKAVYIAYPDEVVIQDYDDFQFKLIQDLEHISITLCGPFSLTPEAREWGRKWYEHHYRLHTKGADNLMGGYVARKQTHLHKLAMIISASHSDDRIITLDDIVTAEQMLTDLEPDMHKVFDNIGRTDRSVHVEQLLNMINATGQMPYTEAYRRVHMFFPSSREFEDSIRGCIATGVLRLENVNGIMHLISTRPIKRPSSDTDAEPE